MTFDSLTSARLTFISQGNTNELFCRRPQTNSVLEAVAPLEGRVAGREIHLSTSLEGSVFVYNLEGCISLKTNFCYIEFEDSRNFIVPARARIFLTPTTTKHLFFNLI